MREIKFRGKSLETGKMVYGSLINNMFFKSETKQPIFYIIDTRQYEDYDSFEDIEYLAIEVDHETVGQYIGIKDKNDKEIKEMFEGDIVKITFDTNFSEKPFYIGVIKYGVEDGYPAFDLVPWIDCEMNALSWLKSECDESVISYEVIGNIHDNPDILDNEM